VEEDWDEFKSETESGFCNEQENEIRTGSKVKINEDGLEY
jgi:hypothetical protein